MPRNVYSTEFIRDGSSDSYTYTCPEGYVALISCIDVYVGIVTDGGNFTAYSQDTGPSDAVVLWSQGFDVPGEQNSRWRGKLVLTAGQSLLVQADGATFACHASGDLLSLP